MIPATPDGSENPGPAHQGSFNEIGTDTAGRYHYQAEVAFPYCLLCGLDPAIIAIVLEHHEDIAVELQTGWRFVQVKSRNPERGLWRLAHLLEAGGALRKVADTFLATRDGNASLEIVLEGATASTDLIQHLLEGGNRANPELINRLTSALSWNQVDVASLLERVTVEPKAPARQDIRARNLYLLQTHRPSISHQTAVGIYDQCLAAIERAMRAESLGTDWPRYAVDPRNRSPTWIVRFAAKRLTREFLISLFGPVLGPAQPILRRITDAGADLSTLERKLLSGGADASIIEEARLLRANSAARWEELHASDLYPSNDQVIDLELRIQTFVTARRLQYLGVSLPANRLWGDVLETISRNSSAIDPSRLLHADPLLLMGHACELSQRCMFEWGAP